MDTATPDTPAAWSSAIFFSVRSVPFVPITTVAPRPAAWEAMVARSSRSSGSPPDRMNIGAGLIARISSMIRMHSSVVNSSVADSSGPAEM